MRSLGLVSALTLALLVPAGYDAAVAADHDRMPSKAEVRAAQDAVVGQQGRVQEIQGELAAANQQLQDAAMKADQAYEAWNGARYRLQQARKVAAAAAQRATIAGADVDRQRQAYTDAIVSSYEQSPELAAISSIVKSDGIGSVLQQTTTMQSTEQAMNSRYDAFRASATLAQVAATQADVARQQAADLAVQARQARDAAKAAADSAAARAQAIGERKNALISELARLQHVSTALAAQRQAALEQRAAERAAAAKAAAEKAAQEKAAQEKAAQEKAAQAAAQAAAQQAHQQAQQHHQSNGSSQAHHQPSPPSAPSAPPAPPAPAGGASAAIAFARAQIGDPYVWGATGPSSWDCSGLTMGAWRAGGRSLPHYSVAQYEQSTPISSADLQPGDLVFWGSSSDPSSIFHVALYSGNGMIIQAPRTGETVREESMYYWTPPNFFARP